MVEDNQNPYAPPVETRDDYVQPPPEGGGLSISAHGWEMVASMSKWMRIVSGLQYAMGALVILGGLFIGCKARTLMMAGASGIMIFSAMMMFAYAVLLFLGATWLRKAAIHFYEGVVSDHESPLALGFRNLRLYLILYGIFAVVGLVGQVVKLAMAR